MNLFKDVFLFFFPSSSSSIYSGTSQRWYVANSCSDEHFFACQNIEDPHDWVASSSAGPFSVLTTYCPDGYKFSIPHDGFEQQKVWPKI